MEIRELLDESQEEQINEFIEKQMQTAMLNNFDYRNVLEEVRGELSYNQLVMLSTLYITEHISNRLNKYNSIIKEFKKL